ACRDTAREPLRAACDDGTPAVRVEAALAYWRVTGEADAPLAVLRPTTNGNDGALALRALKALGDLGPRAAPALPELVQALGGAKQAAARTQAALVIARLGRDGRLAYPTLHWASEDNDAAVRQMARAAITAVGKPTAADVRGLVKVLAEPGQP